MNLIFDLDDTLYDMMQPFVRACHTIWEAPLPFDPWALFIRSRRISDQLYPLIAQGKMSVDEVGTARILQAAQELGEDIGEQAARRFQQHYRRFQYEAQLSDEMRALLDELSRSPLIIGILTNGPADHQRRKIEGLGLTRWFAEDHIFISGVIGMQKPDPRAFLHVQQALGLDPAKTWYIGDSPSCDVKGALDAGWHMLFFNRRAHRITMHPDITISDEHTLIDWIRKAAVLR